MTVLARAVTVAVVLLLVAACAAEPEAPTPEPAAAKLAAPRPAANTSGADADFARFIRDPTNAQSWRWLCRAAAGGHTAAQYTVAVRYRDGLSPVAQNLPRAYLWFTTAAKGGLTAAALAREEVEKRLPEGTAETLRKRSEPLTEADCRKGKSSSK